MKTGISRIVALIATLWASHAVAQKATDVNAIGQAVIHGGDTPTARDRAIRDAMRKAVEQAVGTMIDSQTVTKNYELISDRILSKSMGYVRKHEIVSEGEQKGGIYQVTIKASVAKADLKKDVAALSALLAQKNMPRVLVMIAEQHVGQSKAEFWWGDKNFSTSLNVIENVIIDSWGSRGVKFVDRQALVGKLEVGPAMSSAAPSNDQVKAFAQQTGAEVVLIGQGVATNTQSGVMGSAMNSVTARLSIRVLKLDTGEIVGTATQVNSAIHVNTGAASTQALKKVSQLAAEELIKKLTDRWQSEVGGATTVNLSLTGIKKLRNLRTIKRILQEQIRGVTGVRQKHFKGSDAELEVDVEGSAEQLAGDLEDKKFPGFAMRIDEISQNTIKATIK